MTLALFDLDNTLIGGDSDYLWGEFVVSKSLVDVEEYQRLNHEFYLDYINGSLDVPAYLRFSMAPLAKIEPELLAQLHSEFMRECIDPIWLTKAETLIKQHRDFGRQVAVITATNRFIVEPIVQRFGVENLICSEPEILNGRYTGNFVGEPCFAEGKVIKIEEWLAANSLDLNSSWFYSDSHNDLPLLRKVTRPIAVDPDEKLKEIAQENDWQIISLR